MAITTEITAPIWPQTADGKTVFNQKSDALAPQLINIQEDMNAYATEANALATEVNGYQVTASDAAVAAANSASSASSDATLAEGYKNDAESAATTAANDVVDIINQTATSTANFVGIWSEQTGALNVPASVSEGESVYLLLEDLADVTLWQPSLNPDKWLLLSAGAVTTMEFLAAGDIVQGETISLVSEGYVKKTKPLSTELSSNFNTGYGGVPCSIAISKTRALVALYDSSTSSPIIILYDTSGATPAVLDSATPSFGVPVYVNLVQINATQAIYVARDGGNSNHGSALVVNFTDSTVSVGATQVFNSFGTDEISADRIDDGSAVITYRNVEGDDFGYALTVDVLANSLSFNSATPFTNYSASAQDVATLTSDKFCVVYRDATNSYLKTRIGQISGGVVSFPEAEVTITTLTSNYPSIAKIDDNSIVVTARVSSTIKASKITVSSFTPSASSLVDVSDSTIVSDELSISMFDENTAIAIFVDSTNSDYLTLKTINTASMSVDANALILDSSASAILFLSTIRNENHIVLAHRNTSSGTNQLLSYGQFYTDTIDAYIGVAENDAVEGETVQVTKIGNVNEFQTGLTLNSMYFLDAATGDLTQSDTGIEVGKAISDTKLLITTAGV